MKKILILIFIALLLMQPSYAFWVSNISGNSDTSQGTVTIGTWNIILPLDIETEYEEGDQFIYNDQIWEVVDINRPVEPGETRMLVIVPGEGVALVAITGDGSGKTIVVRIK